MSALPSHAEPPFAVPSDGLEIPLLGPIYECDPLSNSPADSWCDNKSAGTTDLPLSRRQVPPMRLDALNSSKAYAVVGFDVDHRSHSYVERPRGVDGNDPKGVSQRPRKITITREVAGFWEFRRDRAGPFERQERVRFGDSGVLTLLIGWLAYARILGGSLTHV